MSKILIFRSLLVITWKSLLTITITSKTTLFLRGFWLWWICKQVNVPKCIPGSEDPAYMSWDNQHIEWHGLKLWPRKQWIWFLDVIDCLRDERSHWLAPTVLAFNRICEEWWQTCTPRRTEISTSGFTEHRMYVWHLAKKGPWKQQLQKGKEKGCGRKCVELWNYNLNLWTICWTAVKTCLWRGSEK